MVNDICVADEKNNLWVKYADDITVIAPVRNGNDSAPLEVNNIQEWAKKKHEPQPEKDMGDGYSWQDIKA